MKAEQTEAVWLTEENEFSLAQIAELACVTETELRELVDYGAVTPVDPEATPWVFNGKCLLTIRTACRLRVSFDLDAHGVALIVSLLERIHGLETQIVKLQAQLPRRPR